MPGATPCSRWSELPVKMIWMLQICRPHRLRKQRDLPEIKMASQSGPSTFTSAVLNRSTRESSLKSSQVHPRAGGFSRFAVVYFSPRLLCRFDLVVRAISIRLRMASDRDGLSLCCLAWFKIIPSTSVAPNASSSWSVALLVARRGRHRSRRSILYPQLRARAARHR
jgi:hypothetical protein